MNQHTTHRTSLSWMNESINCWNCGNKSSEHMTSKYLYFRNRNTETSLSISPKRALLCLKKKKEEGGVLAQLSYFFQWKTPHHQNSLFRSSFVPILPENSHFCISSKWPAEVIELSCWLLWANGREGVVNIPSTGAFYWSASSLITLPYRWQRENSRKVPQTSKMKLEQ